MNHCHKHKSVSPSFITFDANNSDSWNSVTVTALNNTNGRRDYQSYPYNPDVLKGPLYVSGGVDNTIDVTTLPALMLPGEIDATNSISRHHLVIMAIFSLMKVWIPLCA
jgi:hypothetical protein